MERRISSKAQTGAANLAGRHGVEHRNGTEGQWDVHLRCLGVSVLPADAHEVKALVLQLPCMGRLPDPIETKETSVSAGPQVGEKPWGNCRNPSPHSAAKPVAMLSGGDWPIKVP